MGGAALAPANITPVAQANIWHDPEAAALVLAADWEYASLCGCFLGGFQPRTFSTCLSDNKGCIGLPVAQGVSPAHTHFLDEP